MKRNTRDIPMKSKAEKLHIKIINVLQTMNKNKENPNQIWQFLSEQIGFQ